MIRENEVISEVQENGYIKRMFLREMAISGGGNYEGLTKDSTVRLFNNKVLLDSEGVDSESGSAGGEAQSRPDPRQPDPQRKVRP